MDTIKLSEEFKNYFIENGQFPAKYYDILSNTNVLGREARTGDYKYVAFISPSLKGFFNWHTHVKFGVKATIVKVGPSTVLYQDNLQRIDELVIEYYDNEVDVSAIDAKNAVYYAEQCINYVKQKLIDEKKSDLLKYIYPSEVDIEDEPEEENNSEEQWVYIFRHPKVKNELKIGMTVRHWKERYAEANMNTYTSRDLEVVATFPCKDCRAVERLIHSHLDQYRLPPKTGQKKQPEWFEFPEEKVDEVVEKIGLFMKSIELLSI